MGEAEELPRARLTPYEFVFGGPEFEDDRFPRIREEAGERGGEPADPEAFLFLAAAGALLRELVPGDEPAAVAGASPGAGEVAAEPPPGAPDWGESLGRYGRFVYHAYQFWRFGRRVWVVEEPLLRRLLETPPAVGRWAMLPPHPAGYLQLPRNLLWARVAASEPPEPVDGVFWTMIGESDPAQPPYARLDLLVALGLRPGRPGLSVIDIGEELAGDAAGHWADAVGRPEGDDFANLLPGGELQQYHGMATRGEVLRLVSLLFWHATMHPDAVVAGAALAETPGPGRPPEHARELPPSALPYTVLREPPAGGAAHG
jgi:hypothetical protein